ncbi:MAG: Ig-like domain-containing protein, partial [Opitutaceae bacterium]
TVAGAPATVVARRGDIFNLPSQNESFGPVNVPITITALARGTFPVSGYTYKFFVNGVELGSSVNIQPPGGGEGRVSWAPPQPGAYLLTVEASDGAHTVTTLPVRYFATGTSFVSPVNNTIVPNGSSVVLQATAMPPPSPTPAAQNAFVERMEFYVDGQLVGTDSTYPYSFIYTPSNSPTTHTVEARGYDNNGTLISSLGTATRQLFMVSPVGMIPDVRIVNPPDGSSVSAGIQMDILADAVSPNGFIRKVEFYVNGVLLSTSQTFPFKATWKPDVPGRYQWVAIGYDDKSNAVASSPITLTATGSFPTASIIDPDRSGLTVVQGSIVPVTVRAAGPDGGLISLKTIEFLVDGIVNDSLPKAVTTTGTGPTGTAGSTTPVAPILAEPFVFNWKSNVALGTHRFSTRVTAANGLSITSAEITVNVVANRPPQAEIASPTGSSTIVMNSATTIVANPTDADGTIDQVDFFVNGVSIGSAKKAPFQIAWTPTNSGSYDLTVRATDNGGATALSPAVTVNVDPPATLGSGQVTLTYSVYRGDYGSAGESGRFAFSVNRNNRGTMIAYSTTPANRNYLWTDIAINGDGTFVVRDAANAVVLTGQTSVTGVSGNFGGKTFIGPITSDKGVFAPLQLTGSLSGVAGSQVVAIIGGDGSITLHVSSGNNREVGSDLLGATGNYSFAAASGGRFSGTVANSVAIVSGTVSGAVSGSFLLRPQASRLTNISARTLAGVGDRTLVAGFVVSGSGNKPLLIRAVGPTLANFGVANPVADPSLNVVNRLNVVVGSNNDWGNASALTVAATQVGAFQLTPGSRDAAVQVSVAAGTYTAVIGGANPAGTALVEIYDTETTATFSSRITNISTRGQIGAGDALIAGFVISGDLRKKVLIRAIGPTLASFGITGALADPKIDVFAGATVIASNNDWSDPSVFAQVAATSPIVGAFPLAANSKDSALVLNLTPGAYTVQIAGVGGTTGTALIEIYDADL